MRDQTVTLSGGCHCGAVRFECDAPADWKVLSCNCSMCSRSSYLHLIIARTNFRLQKGEGDLTCYTFNTGMAQHLFCRHCGVKSFYVPRSHPDCYSINARCLDGVDADALEPVPFDGRNWEAAAGKLKGDPSLARREGEI